ncbi:hypothetical protein [Bdellovibrio bacteriovorus]|uniref:Uncharacterized protein n=1 Tax=Bdellovibrio bacteriovorus TaxID=959 RepID=A0A1Z3N5M7_BDEBC|nr:hypothetical protein [Bdellovibrio bacteriovorus]ASD62768.1 hypothetical protein B9G79_03895 [Bdellovibrio bacteriovorus]
MKSLSVILFSFAVFAVPALSWAGLKDVRPCLSEHIHEALVLNKERKPLYMNLSDGKSKAVSDKLIWMERKLSVAVPFADAWAAPYQAAGIPILCQDFISMSETPKFQAQNPEGPDSLHNYRRPDIAGIKSRLLELYKAKAYQQLAEYADKQIVDLDQKPRYNCMVKHILESVRRMAALTPVHAQKSKAKNKVSSEFLSRTVLRSHIMLLDDSAEIDEVAAPLQAAGLPIVCQDVPYIPWP